MALDQIEVDSAPDQVDRDSENDLSVPLAGRQSVTEPRRGLSQRQFLKTLAAALGLAGVGTLALDAKKSEASYIPGPPDRVDTDLRVQGTLTADGDIAAGSANSWGYRLYVAKSGAEASGLIDAASNGYDAALYLQARDSSGVTKTASIRSNTQGHLELNPGGGNVGIGTANPGADAPARAEIVNTAPGTRTTALVLRNNASTTFTGVSLDFTPNVNIPLARLYAVRTDSGAGGVTDLVLANYNGSSVSDTVRIKGNGYVGVGTSAPTEMLDVAGNAHLTGGVLKMNGVVAVDTSQTAKRAYYDT